jgi:hypothetical protein
MGAAFTASAARVRAALPTDHLRPVQIVPGTTVVYLSALEYRRFTDAGGQVGTPYNEVVVGIPVLAASAVNVPCLPLLRPEWFKSFGLYVHHMPVTTQEALDAGVEILGAPKFLAEITFEETARGRRCRLRADGREILTLDVAPAPTRPRHTDYTLYTVKDGRVLRWRFETRGEYGIVDLRGGASYTLGDHPIADELRCLRMGHTALERIYAPRLQAMLHPPPQRLPSVRAEDHPLAPARR